MTTFPNTEAYDELVLVRDIPLRSVCEHHLLPFVGVAHVGYLPAARIVGLSKLARTVDHVARGAQTQERLTAQVADHLQQHLSPHGVGVVVEAEHTCMSVRGARAAGARTVTAGSSAGLREDPATRAEFLALTTATRDPVDDRPGGRRRRWSRGRHVRHRAARRRPRRPDHAVHRRAARAVRTSAAVQGPAARQRQRRTTRWSTTRVGTTSTTSTCAWAPGSPSLDLGRARGARRGRDARLRPPAARDRLPPATAGHGRRERRPGRLPAHARGRPASRTG